MNPHEDTALDVARRIADGEAIDLSALEASDPALARRLGKLQALVRSMHMGAEAGNSWGHLQQLQIAGEGGFGAVYRAYDPTLDRTVALKLRHQRSDALLPSGRDFVAEARRLARVRHPNVLAVHGASYHNGRAGLWADWIEGETLTARLQRTGPLHRDELLRVLSELADAIDAVHRAGLVHGDIKASNVMLDAQGRVILMDFGAGFESSDEGSAVSAGTPRYLAPEIAAGKPGTSAVDLYAYGVLAHLLAVNHYPEAYRPSAALRPRALRNLIAQALDQDPGARPKASKVRQRLQQLIDAPRRNVRRALLASVLLGLFGITLATAIGLRREQAQRHVAERVSDFLASLYREQDPLARGSNQAQAPAATVAEAVARVDRELIADPLTAARLLKVLGEAQLSLDELGAAAATLTHAHELATRADDALLGAEIDAIRGSLALREGRQDDAERLFDGAHAIAVAKGGADSIGAARIDARRAISLVYLGRFKDARAAAEEADRVLSAQLAEGDSERIAARINLGVILEQLREDALAQAAFRSAIAAIETAFGPDDARLVAPLMSLGEVLRRRRGLDEARALLTRAAAIARAQFGARHSKVANVLMRLATVERDGGNARRAVAVLDEAEAALGDAGAESRAQLLATRGGTWIELGDGARAETDLREAVRLRRETGGLRTGLVWFTQAQLGESLMLQGRLDEADALQSEAAGELRKLLGPDAYQNALIADRWAKTFDARGDARNAATQWREVRRLTEKTYGVAHHGYLEASVALATSLSTLAEGRAEATTIVDAILGQWSDKPEFAAQVADAVVLRCRLHLAANERPQAVALAQTALQRIDAGMDSERRASLQAIVDGN